MIKAIKFALEGWKEMGLRHANFQRQLVVALGALFLGYITKLSRIEWTVLFLTIGLVLTAEMANSAVEAVVDLITEERKQKAKIAKDVAAGVVLFTAIISIIVGVLLFFPKF